MRLLRAKIDLSAPKPAYRHTIEGLDVANVGLQPRLHVSQDRLVASGASPVPGGCPVCPVADGMTGSTKGRPCKQRIQAAESLRGRRRAFWPSSDVLAAPFQCGGAPYLEIQHQVDAGAGDGWGWDSWNGTGMGVRT